MKIVHFLSRFKHLKKKLGTSWRAFCDPRTPLSAKLILSLAILGYVIMPLDAIPDFIVFFWLADDIVVIPILIWIFMKFVPEEVKDSVSRSEQK